MNEQRRDLLYFVYGVIMGVLGNFLVSTVIENAKSSGFVERTVWGILLAFSWFGFFYVFGVIGRELGFTDRTLRALRNFAIIGAIFVLFMWLLEFYIMPTLMRSI